MDLYSQQEKDAILIVLTDFGIDIDRLALDGVDGKTIFDQIVRDCAWNRQSVLKESVTDYNECDNFVPSIEEQNLRNLPWWQELSSPFRTRLIEVVSKAFLSKTFYNDSTGFVNDYNEILEQMDTSFGFYFKIFGMTTEVFRAYVLANIVLISGTPFRNEFLAERAQLSPQEVLTEIGYNPNDVESMKTGFVEKEAELFHNGEADLHGNV
jgi:hypothetical protein